MKTDKQLLEWFKRNYEVLYNAMVAAGYDKQGLIINASYVYVKHVRTIDV